jgi:hypothetical protein
MVVMIQRMVRRLRSGQLASDVILKESRSDRLRDDVISLNVSAHQRVPVVVILPEERIVAAEIRDGAIADVCLDR